MIFQLSIFNFQFSIDMNWLDILIIVCVAIGLIKGLFDGFIKQVVSFVALVVAILFAGQVAVLIRAFLSGLLGQNSISPPILTGFSYLFAFVLIIILIVLLGKIVSFAIKMTPAKPLNIMLGGLIGACFWILSLSIVFNILGSINKDLKVIPKQIQQNSVFYSKVKNVVPIVYPYIKDYFNTTEIRKLETDTKQSISSLADLDFVFLKR